MCSRVSACGERAEVPCKHERQGERVGHQKFVGRSIPAARRILCFKSHFRILIYLVVAAAPVRHRHGSSDAQMQNVGMERQRALDWIDFSEVVCFAPTWWSRPARRRRMQRARRSSPLREREWCSGSWRRSPWLRLSRCVGSVRLAVGWSPLGDSGDSAARAAAGEDARPFSYLELPIRRCFVTRHEIEV